MSDVARRYPVNPFPLIPLNSHWPVWRVAKKKTTPARGYQLEPFLWSAVGDGTISNQPARQWFPASGRFQASTGPWCTTHNFRTKTKRLVNNPFTGA
jgi:hypothetical protein